MPGETQNTSPELQAANARIEHLERLVMHQAQAIGNMLPAMDKLEYFKAEVQNLQQVVALQSLELSIYRAIMAMHQTPEDDGIYTSSARANRF